MGRKGQLIVQPGARVQLDCIYSRDRGTPQWTWSNLMKEYPTGRELSQLNSNKVNEREKFNSGWATKDKKKNWNYRLDLNSVIIEVLIIWTAKYWINTGKHLRTLASSTAAHRGAT